MSHFYGTLDGQAGQATRCGSKRSGYKAVAASWQGAVEVVLHHDSVSGKDMVTIHFVPWQGTGGGPDAAGRSYSRTLLYRGPVNPNETELLVGLSDRLANAITREAE